MGANNGQSAGAMKLSFVLISLIHDNRMLRWFKDPYRLLKAAGLRNDLQVLEVGCGPGFYTVPAAEIVGQKGTIYAIDVNPWAIKRIKEKIALHSVSNIKPIHANAAECGLPDNAIDLAFLFGLPRVMGGMERLLLEMRRVIKLGGLLTLQSSGRLNPNFRHRMTELGFETVQDTGRLLRYKRIATDVEKTC